MRETTVLLAALLPTLTLAAWPGNSSKKSKDAILLSDVAALTLHGHGARTSHRRVPSVAQMQCISHPSLCRLVDLDTMRCTNEGSSYADGDVEWSCTATLPEELRLGSTDVICEGYSGPDDPYILRGSCGVEYRLALTPKGEQRYPDVVGALERGAHTDSDLWLPTIVGVIFCLIFACIIFGFLRECWSGSHRSQRPRRPGSGSGRRPGGGGGGGWGPRFGRYHDDDPPPPYPGPNKSPPGGSTSPGFWSGLAAGGAAGAAAGYAAGSRNRNLSTGTYHEGYNRNRNRNHVRGSYRGGIQTPNPRLSPPATSASQPGPSDVNYESTGFGSTSRR